MKGRPARTTHGDYGYATKRRCPCDPCRLAVSRYAKRLAYDKANGVRRRCDAAPVRAHVQQLVDQGATPNAVARAAGVTRSQVQRLLFGNPHKESGVVEFLMPKTALALMEVTLTDALAELGFVPAVGTHRRIQALAARGYTKAEIGLAMGVSDSAVFNLMARDTLTLGVAEKVKVAYEKLCMGSGSSETMRWRALREGWLPPLAWDEHTMDDPDAKPDRSAVKCAVEKCHRQIQRGCLCKSHYEMVTRAGGFRSSRHFREAVQRLSRRSIHDRPMVLAQLADLREMGLGPDEAAKALGRGPEYVRKLWSEVAS